VIDVALIKAAVREDAYLLWVNVEAHSDVVTNH
jgi:hypothetical protein